MKEKYSETWKAVRRDVHRWIRLFSSVEMKLCMHKNHTLWKWKRGCLWMAARSFTCGLIFFTSQHFASTSELLPSVIGLYAFLPGHYDLIHKLDRNQVCSSSLNQSAIPFQFFGFIFSFFFSFESLWSSYYYSYFFSWHCSHKHRTFCFHACISSSC